MNSLDDLLVTLDRYADRDAARGADTVWAAASTRSASGLLSPDATATAASPVDDPVAAVHVPPIAPSQSKRHRPARLVLLSLAAACVLVIIGSAVRSDDSRLDVGNQPTAPTSAAEPPSSDQTTAEPPPPPTGPENGEATVVVLTGDPLVDGESYAIRGVGLPPGRVAVAVCPGADQVIAELCFDPLNLQPGAIVAVEADGTFMLPWLADRSVYGDRWYDCALVSCDLAVIGLGPDGEPDPTRRLSMTPLRFDGTSPPLRPTLALSPEGRVRVGTELTLTGAGFPVGATLGISRCGADVAGSCVALPASWEVDVDDQGRIDTAVSTSSPATAGADNQIDCTAAPGVCVLWISPWEATTEPFASVPLDLEEASAVVLPS